MSRSAIVAVVLAVTLYSLGVPGAGLLGMQAGVANFIPYLGPPIAALPVPLVTMPLGLPTLAWVMAIYFLIQTIEGFVIAPLIQKGSLALLASVGSPCRTATILRFGRDDNHCRPHTERKKSWSLISSA